MLSILLDNQSIITKLEIAIYWLVSTTSRTGQVSSVQLYRDVEQHPILHSNTK